MANEPCERANTPPPQAAAIELRVGQLVPYPPAPGGVAQVEELLRRRVGLLYLRGRRVCRRRVSAAHVAAWCAARPVLPLIENVLGRGLVRRSKRYAC